MRQGVDMSAKLVVTGYLFCFQLAVVFTTFKIVNVLLPAGTCHLIFCPSLNPINAVPIGAKTEIFFSLILALSGGTIINSIISFLSSSLIMTFEFKPTTSGGK